MKNTAFVVVGLGFGDEGKGTIVDSLVRTHNSDLVVRFSGGPQCAHNVVTDDDIHHTFAQFGSGTLSGAKTYLSSCVLINPLSLEREANVLIEKGVENPYENLFIDECCRIITPFHQALNKIQELARGANPHGTCGHGVWEAVKDSMKDQAFSLTVRDFKDELGVRAKLELIQAWKNYELIPLLKQIKETSEVFDINYGILSDKNLISHNLIPAYKNILGKVKIVKDQGVTLIRTAKNPVFEGNQGILLDETYGFAPYNTATSTTTKHADSILNWVGFRGEIKRIGVTRTYTTRHGFGPFPTEDKDLNLSYDDHNPTNRWQGNFRDGYLDVALLKYAFRINKQDSRNDIEYLAITHVDKLEKADKWKIGTSYTHKVNTFEVIANSAVRNGLPMDETLTPLFNEVGVESEWIPSDNLIEYLRKETVTIVMVISKGQKSKDKTYIYG